MDNITIFQSEFTEDFIPIGIKSYMYLYGNKANIKYMYNNTEEEIIKWINSIKDNDIILFPIYKNPLPLINIIIDNIRKTKKNIKIYACGPLAENSYKEVTKYINVDDVVIHNYPFVFYKEKKYKKINTQFGAELIQNKNDDSIKLIIGNNKQCPSKCSYCYNNINNSVEIKLDIEKTISLLQNQKISNLEILHDNIFFDFEISILKNYLIKIHEKIKFNRVFIWSDVYYVDKYIKNIAELTLDNKIDIILRIGFESFSKSQLQRFNKNNIELNYKVLNLLNNNNNNNIFIEPLFLVFDPWCTLEDIYINYEAISNFRKSLLACAYRGLLFSENMFCSRHWIPIKNTPMFNRAQKENLLKIEKFDIFGNAYKEDIDSSEDLSWIFSNKECEYIFNKFIFWNKKFKKECRNGKEFKNKCANCDGKKALFLKEIIKIENNVFEWIKGFNQNIEHLIDKDVDKLITKINQCELKMPEKPKP